MLEDNYELASSWWTGTFVLNTFTKAVKHEGLHVMKRLSASRLTYRTRWGGGKGGAILKRSIHQLQRLDRWRCRYGRSALLSGLWGEPSWRFGAREG
jgi:hypothetical protein